MDQSTTALDVLSHAATLVEAKGNSKYEMEQKNMDCRASPSKELPTREHKLKRNKDRRELPTSASFRIKLKSGSCSPQILSDGEADNSTSAVIEDSLSPSSHAGDQDSSPVVYSCHRYPNSNDVSPSPGRNSCCGSTNKFFSTEEQPPLSDQKQPFISSDSTDNDQPLDMSKKCSWHSNEPSLVTQDTAVQNKFQQHRPSVITCASALQRTQCNLKDSVHVNCDTVETEDKTKNFKSDQRQTSSDCNGCSPNNDARPGHRREILSGMCDPVIEEHFRRSLGKDYPNIFSTSAASVSVTVDDHFAKALGETWLMLQQPKTPSVDPSTSSPSSSTNIPAQSQSPSSFLQHSPSNLHSLHCVEEIA